MADEQGEARGGSRGGGEEPEERTDSWMATYADMVTLLFTFFVLMFAISNVDAQKFAFVAAAFSRDGITPEIFEQIQSIYAPDPEFNPDELFLPFPEGPEEPSPSTDPGEPAEPTDPGTGIIDGPEGGFPGLTDLYGLLGGYVAANGLEDSITLEFDGEYLLIRLSNDVWFASGSADITPPMMEKAQVLGEMLAQTSDPENPFEIVIAGHTDNVPINTPRFPSNWHVSVQRSVNFLEVLIEESGLDPAYFSARGLGEEHPLQPNDTEAGRQANRRVEVFISLKVRDR